MGQTSRHHDLRLPLSGQLGNGPTSAALLHFAACNPKLEPLMIQTAFGWFPYLGKQLSLEVSAWSGALKVLSALRSFRQEAL